MGMLESPKPVGMGSKSILFNSNDKIKSKKRPQFTVNGQVSSLYIKANDRRQQTVANRGKAIDKRLWKEWEI